MRTFPFSAMLLFALSATTAFATPMYFRFEGTVTSISHQDRTSFTVGSSVSYLFLVDREADGVVVHHTHATTLSDEPGIDFFFVKYLTGATQPVTPFDWDSFYFGSESVGPEGVRVTLNGSEDSTDGLRLDSKTWNRVSIGSGLPIDQWTPGTSGYSGLNAFQDFIPGIGNFTVVIASDLTLTSVSETNPVPEPSTSYLLGLGAILIFLAIFRRKRPRSTGV